MPPWPCTFPSNDPRSRCMKCWTLPDACVEYLPADNASIIYGGRPGRGTLALYREPPLRIHVAGMSRAELSQLLKPNQIGNLRDPLNSELLRHLEHSIFFEQPSNAQLGSSHRMQQRRRRDADERRGRAARTTPHGLSRADAGDNLTMIWPLWEMGFGDVLANTLLPLGSQLPLGSPPPAQRLARSVVPGRSPFIYQPNPYIYTPPQLPPPPRSSPLLARTRPQRPQPRPLHHHHHYHHYHCHHIRRCHVCRRGHRHSRRSRCRCNLSCICHNLYRRHCHRRAAPQPPPTTQPPPPLP